MLEMDVNNSNAFAGNGFLEGQNWLTKGWSPMVLLFELCPNVFDVSLTQTGCPLKG
jgi:hypothetical protein